MRMTAATQPSILPENLHTLLDSYSVSIISSEQEIRRLPDLAPSLFHACGPLARPSFFLAGSYAPVWQPRVAVVRDRTRIVGVFFCKERVFLGLPSGIIQADGSLESPVVSDAGLRESVFLLALRALSRRPGVRAIRLLVAPDGYEISNLAYLSSQMELSFRRIEYHSRLPLAATYELFLEELGRHTRRNFRHSRRQNAASHIFHPNLSSSDFQRIALILLGEGAVGSRRSIARAFELIHAADRPLIAGLQNVEGEWLSVVCGWYEQNRVVILLQMNSHKKHANASLSLVLRGYLIERLIGEGVRELVFWHGLRGPLQRYAHWIPTIAVHLDSSRTVWRSFRHFVRIGRSLLPRELSKLTEWIVHSRHTTAEPEERFGR